MSRGNLRLNNVERILWNIVILCISPLLSLICNLAIDCFFALDILNLAEQLVHFMISWEISVHIFQSQRGHLWCSSYMTETISPQTVSWLYWLRGGLSSAWSHTSPISLTIFQVVSTVNERNCASANFFIRRFQKYRKCPPPSCPHCLAITLVCMCQCYHLWYSLVL